jgi:exonuclease VII small subunit
MSDKPMSTLTPEDIFGEPISREDAIALLQASPETYTTFLHFPREVQDRLIAFITGQKSITINYDPFFKKIFDPAAHPKRLEQLISAILGFDVKIESVLEREGVRLSSDGSFVIMDIIVRLANGAYLSVEIQKIGYDFPGERSACYASDMIIRQYNAQKSILGDAFSYNKLYPVYLIVLIENSSAAMKAVAPHYMHNRIVSYDSGAKIRELSNICYISLDTFRKRGQNKIEKPLDAWLTLLSESEPAAVINLINQCPEFLDIYQEIAEFRKQPKELIYMCSEMLAIMDRNMETLMIEKARVELDEAHSQLNEAHSQLDEAHSQLDEAHSQLDEAHSQLDEAHSQLDEVHSQLNQTLVERDNAVTQRDNALRQNAEKDSEIAALKAQLAALTK